MSEEYKKIYEPIWLDDSAFSQKFSLEIHQILSQIKLPIKIMNNLGTFLDIKQGEDVTRIIPMTRVGIRVRRYYSETGFCYKTKNQFTQDFKERDTAKLDMYFYGYSNPSETKLDSYIIFDYADFVKGRKNRKIPIKDTPINRNHSLVPFNCWSLKDIEKNCRIFRKHGEIGCLKRELTVTETKLSDFYWY